MMLKVLLVLSMYVAKFLDMLVMCEIQGLYSPWKVLEVKLNMFRSVV